MGKIVDILESEIEKEILEILLRDHTTGNNIFWGTKDYDDRGEGFREMDYITYDAIAENDVIIPRVRKSKDQRTSRSRSMAEVFTPAWVCNTQNNLIDREWFGKKIIFNQEVINNAGHHSWKVNNKKIKFPKGKSWKDYVSEPRLEITCGEAPYLASRYDAATGDYIEVKNRIGLLDRKLRVVGENVENKEEWYKYCVIAYKSVYGFEWQGDNLLLARESLFQTFIDYYCDKYPGEFPSAEDLKEIAWIISWNLWQMDGMKGVIPNSCHDELIIREKTLFDVSDDSDAVVKCKGCTSGEIHMHNGKKCLIMDWEKMKSVEFISLLS